MDEWTIHHGDCIPHMASLADGMFDFSVFSPPFPSLYAYTSEAGDIGIRAARVALQQFRKPHRKSSVHRVK